MTAGMNPTNISGTSALLAAGILAAGQGQAAEDTAVAAPATASEPIVPTAPAVQIAGATAAMIDEEASGEPPPPAENAGEVAGETAQATTGDETTAETTGDETAEGTAPPAADPLLADQTMAADEGEGEGGETAEAITPTATAGRVTTFEPVDSDQVASIRILEGPDHGNLTINPDNTLALVMSGSDYTGPLSFTTEVTLDNGTVKVVTTNLDVEAGSQEAGWGEGDHYMLATDENDDVIVEAGRNSREVYVSGSDDALTKADIAALEGLEVDKITGQWLANHPQYGSTPGMALAEDAGKTLWGTITGADAEPSSNALLFERGYEYGDSGGIIAPGTMGESELHPVQIGAWGEGDRPVITSRFQAIAGHSENVVVTDLQFTGGVLLLDAKNFLFDDVGVSDEGFTAIGVSGLTIRNSEIRDITDDKPSGPGGTWSPGDDRMQGIYISQAEGVLLEGNFIANNGWAEGYDRDLDGDDPQAPSKFSHNVYLQNNTRDVTFRDNIDMQAASAGAQFRGGAFVENNLFLDNNFAFNILGGDYHDAGPVGNYSLVLDNVITSAGYKYLENIGYVSLGMQNIARDTALVGNIVTHLADPNNPLELLFKVMQQTAVTTSQPLYFNDTAVYNWNAASAIGKVEDWAKFVTGIDRDLLRETTIQNFTAALLGTDDASIDDLGDYLRAQADSDDDDRITASEINDFFQDVFGRSLDERDEAATLRFTPDDRGDGVRWDNRLNWDTEDLPGSGDSVDLHGNWVTFGGNVGIEDLDFGEGGKLAVNQGLLEIDGEVAVGAGGGTLSIDESGQVWIDGYADRQLLTVDVAGGRFANTGIFKGKVDMTVSDNGQAILATGGASFDLTAGSTLEIVGRDTRVGFDGENGDLAVLRLDDESTLRFTAEDGLGRIREFMSGRYGDERPQDELRSGADLGDARLEIDITDMNRTSCERVLMRVDELIGQFGELDVIGLGDSRDATVVIDYETDTVVLRLGAAGQGSGLTEIQTLNDEMEGPESKVAQDLWEALTAGHGVQSDDPIGSDEDDLLEPVA